MTLRIQHLPGDGRANEFNKTTSRAGRNEPQIFARNALRTQYLDGTTPFPKHLGPCPKAERIQGQAEDFQNPFFGIKNSHRWPALWRDNQIPLRIINTPEKISGETQCPVGNVIFGKGFPPFSERLVANNDTPFSWASLYWRYLPASMIGAVKGHREPLSEFRGKGDIGDSKFDSICGRGQSSFPMDASMMRFIDRTVSQKNADDIHKMVPMTLIGQGIEFSHLNYIICHYCGNCKGGDVNDNGSQG